MTIRSRNKHATTMTDLALDRMSTNPPRSNLPLWTRLVFAIADRVEEGRLTVTMPDGRVFVFAGERDGVDAALIVRDPNFARRFVMGGAIGFAEGYMAGEFDTPDLALLLELFARNVDILATRWRGSLVSRTAARLGHLLNRNTRGGARRNIHAHYDLGNAFYARWLDETMTYSSARFADPGEPLSDAQRRKYRTLAEGMALQRGDRVLEIGSGWGGFAEVAAGEFGAQVVGLTISREQFAFAQERIRARGLQSQVEFRLQDYRDATGTFDRIASIEMFEAVGEEYWPSYFQTVRDRLRPGGSAGLQIITIRDQDFATYRRSVDFIQKYIFPGGMLPSPAMLRTLTQRAGLDTLRNVTFGLDYARTLNEWRQRFLGAWDEIVPLGFDERFRRLWEYYLAYCEAGFRAGMIDVTQLTLVKP